MIVGVLIRIRYVPVGGYPGDVRLFIDWGQTVARAGPGAFYAPGYFADYFSGHGHNPDPDMGRGFTAGKHKNKPRRSRERVGVVEHLCDGGFIDHFEGVHWRLLR